MDANGNLTLNSTNYVNTASVNVDEFSKSWTSTVNTMGKALLKNKIYRMKHTSIFIFKMRILTICFCIETY